MNKSVKKIFALGMLAASVASHAQSTPKAYDFQIQWREGDLIWQISRGSFSYDPTMLVVEPNISSGPDISHGPLSSFDFNLKGHQYSLADLSSNGVSLWGNSLVFMSASVGNYSAAGVKHIEGEFRILYDGYRGFPYGNTVANEGPNDIIGFGNAYPVPEPETLSLALAGLAVTLLIASRKPRSTGS